MLRLAVCFVMALALNVGLFLLIMQSLLSSVFWGGISAITGTLLLLALERPDSFGRLRQPREKTERPAGRLSKVIPIHN
jgi:hypothetical protein